MSISSNGLVVSASGYDQNLPDLLLLVSSQLRSFPLDPAIFERRLDVIKQGLQNFKLRQPVSLTRCA